MASVSQQQHYILENNEVMPSIFLGKNVFHLEFYIYLNYQSNVAVE